MRTTRVLPVAAALAVVTWLLFWQPTPPARHVIVVSIDALRPDHLGCYGYARPTSTAIDAFAAESVRFAHAISQAPSSLSSHASLLTSRLPHHHRASFVDRRPLAPDVTTLAEVLRERGFRTAAWSAGGGQMALRLGLERGFELYEPVATGGLGAVVERAVAWLDAREPGDRFFLLLHAGDPDLPFTPDEAALATLEVDGEGRVITAAEARGLSVGEDESVDTTELERVVDAYDAEIVAADRIFADLIEQLRRRQLLSQTLIVLTSAHGIELGERGKVARHGHSLYDELLAVPLLVRPIALDEGRVVNAQVRLIDVAPTILADVGLEPVADFSGRSLLGLIDGDEEVERAAISRRDRGGGTDLGETSIRKLGWKLWGERLFDLNTDPDELEDRAFDHPIVADRMAEELDRSLAGGAVD